MKTCSKCGQSKPLDAFAKDSRKSDGRRPQCKSCCHVKDSERYQANREKALAYAAKYRAENGEKARQACRNWYAKNRQTELQKYADWCVENKDKVRAYAAKRHAAKLRATPPWADHEAIAAVYTEQQWFLDLGVDCHVDHIIPLQGKTVCGLHVHWNLRVILAGDNLQKSNRLLEGHELACP